MNLADEEKIFERKEIVTDIISKHKKILVFGAGKTGSDICRILKAYNLFSGYVDNDLRKQQDGYEDEIVFSVNHIRITGFYVIVAGNDIHSQEMCSQLYDMGLEYLYDYIQAEKFLKEWFPVLSLCVYNKSYTNLAQICLTERCTLKCKKCAHACHLVDNRATDMPLEIAKRSADNFFKNFDVVGEFVLIGGEPFLYKNLEEIVEYIGNNYRKQILMFSITTNGTILPPNHIIDLCGKFDITIRISDYSESIPILKRQYERVYSELKNTKYIVWKTNAEKSWFDYGFETVQHRNIEAIKENYNNCKTMCREICDNKYYYCVMAHTVAQNMKLNIGNDDYLDLSEKIEKTQLLKFELGFLPKGYLDMCSRCRGREAVNYLIPAAEQVI